MLLAFSYTIKVVLYKFQNTFFNFLFVLLFQTACPSSLLQCYAFRHILDDVFSHAYLKFWNYTMITRYSKLFCSLKTIASYMHAPGIKRRLNTFKRFFCCKPTKASFIVRSISKRPLIKMILVEPTVRAFSEFPRFDVTNI